MCHLSVYDNDSQVLCQVKCWTPCADRSLGPGPWGAGPLSCCWGALRSLLTLGWGWRPGSPLGGPQGPGPVGTALIWGFVGFILQIHPGAGAVGCGFGTFLGKMLFALGWAVRVPLAAASRPGDGPRWDWGGGRGGGERSEIGLGLPGFVGQKLGGGLVRPYLLRTGLLLPQREVLESPGRPCSPCHALAGLLP